MDELNVLEFNVLELLMSFSRTLVLSSSLRFRSSFAFSIALAATSTHVLLLSFTSLILFSSKILVLSRLIACLDAAMNLDITYKDQNFVRTKQVHMFALLTKTRYIYTKKKKKINLPWRDREHQSHRHHEPLPSRVLVSKKMLRNFFRRLRQGGCMDYGRDLLIRRVLRLRVKVKYLHWGLLIRDERSGFDVLGLGRLVFFRLPRLLGRPPKSTLDDIFFRFSPAGGWGWDCTPCLTTSSVTSLPLFSFIVAIPKRKDVNYKK